MSGLWRLSVCLFYFIFLIRRSAPLTHGALSAISIEPGLGEGQKIDRWGTFDPLKNWNGHEKGHGFELLSLGGRFCLFVILLCFPLRRCTAAGGYGGRWHERDGWMINPLVQNQAGLCFLAEMNVMVVSRVNDKMILPVSNVDVLWLDVV
ncbi:hypothetical protein M431DRAFT_277412 [Trichoderma harzianum CBS 226.95]|uniref:Secreted protein n=1 Tax=Trichoderma harzianum CBS 226.95 TaxID=983964 RepID=A0A2T3ZWW5_TRIHA|nr:hypothetical protein M431DRAFT_277412 [Trichoderma harzianum CBS 226.95]PTB49299.1 hypothetical protein M431DRAFT_277412 [Trichoderma harzianum CBS 226.95]